MYKQSPRCHRKYMADNLLETDWFHVRMCTDMRLSDFDALVSLVHDWTYTAPMNSDNYDSGCMNVFAITGSALYPGAQEPEIIRTLLGGLSQVSFSASTALLMLTISAIAFFI